MTAAAAALSGGCSQCGQLLVECEGALPQYSNQRRQVVVDQSSLLEGGGGTDTALTDHKASIQSNTCTSFVLM